MSKNEEPITWAVVETFENGNRSVTTSAELWIENDILSWPPTGEYAKRKNPTPPEPGWRKIPCKILAKGFKTLKSALAKERKLSVFSNTESENEDKQRKLLKRLHPVQYDNPIDCNVQFNKIKAAKGEAKGIEKPQNQMNEIVFDPVVPDEIFASEDVNNSVQEKDLNSILAIVGYTKEPSSNYAAHNNIGGGQATNKTMEVSNSIPSVPISISCNGEVIHQLSSTSLNANLAPPTQYPYFQPISPIHSQDNYPRSTMNSSTYPPIGHILPNYNYHPHMNASNINNVNNGQASYTQSNMISGQYQSGGQNLPSNYSHTDVSNGNMVDNRLTTTDRMLQQHYSSSFHGTHALSSQYPYFTNISQNYSQANVPLLQENSSSSLNANQAPSAQNPCSKIISPNLSQGTVNDNTFKRPVLAVAKPNKKRQAIRNESIENAKLVKNNNNKQVLTKGVQMVKSKKKVLKPNLPMKQMKQLKKASSTQGKCKEKTRQNERSSLNALENNTSFDDAYSKEHNVQSIEYLKLIYKEVLAIKTFNKNEAAKRNDTDKKIVDMSQKLTRIEGEMLQLKSSNKSNLENILLEQEQIQEFDAYFSIKEKMELEQLVFKLRDPVYTKLLVTRLARIGGTKPQLMLRKIMRYLIHDSVLQLYTWVEGSVDKSPFAEFDQLNTIILRSIQVQHPLYTEDSYNKYMSSYIKQAKFRLEGLVQANNEAVIEEIEEENDDEPNTEGNQNEDRHESEDEELEDYDGEDEDEIEELE